jgi:hypothetical protein
LSIKAALALGRCFGNLRVRARVTEETDDYFLVEAVVIDAQTGWYYARPGRVSKWTKRGGRIERLPEDRHRMAVGAEVSKLIRNGILDTLPVPLWRKYWETARSLAGDVEAKRAGASKKKGDTRGFDIEAAVAKALQRFFPYDVGRASLETKLKKPLEEMVKDDLSVIAGWLNALDEGTTTAAQLFSDIVPDEPAGPVEGQAGADGKAEGKADEKAEGGPSPLGGKVTKGGGRRGR